MRARSVVGGGKMLVGEPAAHLSDVAMGGIGAGAHLRRGRLRVVRSSGDRSPVSIANLREGGAVLPVPVAARVRVRPLAAFCRDAGTSGVGCWNSARPQSAD